MRKVVARVAGRMVREGRVLEEGRVAEDSVVVEGRVGVQDCRVGKLTRVSRQYTGRHVLEGRIT